MGTGCCTTLTCCNKKETSSNIDIENNEINKIIETKINGYNTTQKILELKMYRFFINHLFNLMRISDFVETKEFYFIKKSWIKSWYKYTCYEEIRPLLIENEINNEIDFHKLIIDHKKEINFEGFMERDKPPPIQFFDINILNTNVKENFYIFDSKILKKFVEIYDIADNVEDKDAFSLEGEIGKGRIIFDVKDYILIMILDTNWVINQMMIIFWKNTDHNHFLKSIKGRALSYISKELKKAVQKKKMIKYLKDEIVVYDDRDFIKNEIINNKYDIKEKEKNTQGDCSLVDKTNTKRTNQNENIENIIIETKIII